MTGITHTGLRKLAKADLQAAIDRVRAAPVAFMCEVARDTSYPYQVRGAAAAAVLPYVYGPPPGEEGGDT
jgi:hypothetical protein